MLTNWAGNHVFGATRLETPRSLEELQELIVAEPRVRALGSRHSFTDMADTEGVLVSLSALPVTVEVDEAARSAAVSAGALYGDVAVALHEQGWALGTMASLPHISVAGAIATGTHGSGDGQGSLAAAVNAVELVGADGELRRWARGEPDFDGVVVSVGALGVVTRVWLDVEPAYEMAVDCLVDLPWKALSDDLDAVTSAATSVSLFTDWLAPSIGQVWLKSRVGTPVRPLQGARPATSVLHMLPGGDIAAVTQQGGVPGPWFERLPHFRMSHTPSRGEELQSEYFVPRARAVEAVDAVRRMGPAFAGLLQVSEIRTIAADDLWLSGAQGRDTVGLHFTWVRDEPAVRVVLGALEEVLTPLGARPHWGKVFVADHAALSEAYPRLADFAHLRDRLDPTRRFGNAFLDRVLGGSLRQRHPGGQSTRRRSGHGGA